MNNTLHKQQNIWVYISTFLSGNIIFVTIFKDFYEELKLSSMETIVSIGSFILFICLLGRIMYLTIKISLNNGKLEEVAIFKENSKKFEENFEDDKTIGWRSKFEKSLEEAVEPFKLEWLRSILGKVYNCSIKPNFLRDIIWVLVFLVMLVMWGDLVYYYFLVIYLLSSKSLLLLLQ